MIVYHCTTQKKLDRYASSRLILPPVYYFTTKYSALKWMKKTGRKILLAFNEPLRSYPLPMKNGAMWSDEFVRKWEKVN